MSGTRTIMPTLVNVDLPGVIEIASGTQWATTVRDARSYGPWCTPSAIPLIRKRHTIVYHHTASELPDGNNWGAIRAWLDTGKRLWPFGVPYNFIVMPRHGFRVWYLHDVDQCWPHTYGHNCATAIAAVGNYSEHEAPAGMVAKMLRLADALASMWGEFVPEIQHKDVYATECPGNRLSPLLPRHGRQRATL